METKYNIQIIIVPNSVVRRWVNWNLGALGALEYGW